MKRRSFAVIGLGEFGMTLVEELVALNREVIAIDKDEEAVAKAAKLIPTAFIADSTNEKALKELNIDEVTDAIVCYGDNVTASILTTVILKDLGISHIVVRMDDEYFIPTIKRLGADEVVTPQRIAGIGLANRLGNENFLDYYNLSGSYSVVKITVNKGFEPITLQSLDARNQFGVNIILIERDRKVFSPKGSDMILPVDTINVVGKRREVEDFSSYINPEDTSEVKKKAKK
ncbi:MAG TPA: TrkA family potassium uptake protein [Bacilli bacterium]|nr:TrkA family potassium uptake protein [Bacilli bacterium]